MRPISYYSFLLIFVILTTSFFIVPLEARTWTHKSGRNSFEAELVEVIGENIVLKKSNGQIVTLRHSDLSKKDQNYLSYLKTQDSMRQISKSVAPKVTLPQGIRVEPVAVSVSKSDPIKETPTAFIKGTQITFLVSSSDAQLGNMDRDQVKLECTDDVGSIIGTEKNAVTTWKTDPQGRRILVTFSSSTLPSFGTKKLILSGSVATHAFEGEKTTIEHHVSLTEHSDISLADREILVKKMPDDDFMKFATDIAKMKVAFLSEKPLHHIDKVEFFDNNNEPLTSCTGESHQKTIGGKAWFVKEYYLATATDAFSVKTDFYEKSKVMVIPVALTVDFGL